MFGTIYLCNKNTLKVDIGNPRFVEKCDNLVVVHQTLNTEVRGSNTPGATVLCL